MKSALHFFLGYAIASIESDDGGALFYYEEQNIAKKFSHKYKCLCFSMSYDASTIDHMQVSDKVDSFIDVDTESMVKRGRSECLAYMKEYNDGEYTRAQDELKYWNKFIEKKPNDEKLISRIIFLEAVIHRFEEWYKKNKLKLPDPNEHQKNSVKDEDADKGEAISRSNLDRKEKNITERLKLSPNQEEELNQKIYNAVQEYIDKGKGSQQKSFEYISNRSKKLFGYALTKGQVEGRYKRHPEVKSKSKQQYDTPAKYTSSHNLKKRGSDDY